MLLMEEIGQILAATWWGPVGVEKIRHEQIDIKFETLILLHKKKQSSSLATTDLVR